MNLRYKRRALKDIEAIHDYIAEHDPEAAKRVVLRIQHSISRLARLPFSGRRGVVERTRIVVVPGCPMWRSTASVMTMLMSSQCSTRRGGDGAEQGGGLAEGVTRRLACGKELTD